MAVIGSTRLEPIVGEIMFGDIYLNNKPRRQFIMPGVSVCDFFPKHQDISNAQIFSNIHFHKKSEVELYFNKLKEFDPPIIGPIDEVGWVKRKIVSSGLDPRLFEDLVTYSEKSMTKPFYIHMKHNTLLLMNNCIASLKDVLSYYMSQYKQWK